ncbi:MAG: PilZ domain-containing protein [Deltaproteobacteria bacterium]|nr:PilZ domain-containing protein [Deltaproteobacteria bacterium]
MKEVTTIAFQTSSEIKSSLDKIAAKENKSVPSLVESMVCHYLKNETAIEEICQNRRRFERKKITIPVYIGDSAWQHDEFIEGTLLDISLGGVKMVIPKEAKRDIPNVHETKELSIIFRIPSCYWPIRVKISPQTVSESEDELQLGASLINPDYQAYSALQKYLM